MLNRLLWFWKKCKKDKVICVLKWASHHEDIWRWGNVLLLSALHGGEQSSSLLGYLTSCTHWTGGWVGIWSGLDTVEKTKISCPCQEINPGPVCSLVTIMISYKLIYLKTAKIYVWRKLSEWQSSDKFIILRVDFVYPVISSLQRSDFES